jgi:hypothetical protein
MTNELERAGRTLAESEIAAPTPVATLRRRARQRRVARVATSVVVVAALIVAGVGIASALGSTPRRTLQVANTTTTEQPRVTVPATVVTPHTHRTLPPTTTSTTTTTIDPHVAVPNVVGQSIVQAQALLANLGLRHVTIARSPSASPTQSVLSESPAAGARVLPDDEITLTVAFQPVVKTVAQARALWDSQNIRDYEFDYELTCFCAPTHYRVTVKNGLFVSAFPLDAATANSGDTYQDGIIDSLFQQISNIPKGATVDAKFDPVLGYPTSVTYGCADKRLADCGYTYYIGRFKALGQP